MRTQAQIEASRANGAKSRGPITPEGKRRSSRNATTHGLLSTAFVPEGESEEPFHRHRESFQAEFNPRSAIESALVERMALARWRQLRVWSLESAVFSGTVETLNEINPAVAEVAAQRSAIELCLRYDARFDRQYDQALRRLERIRSPKTSFFAKRTQHFIENKALTHESEPTESQNSGFVSTLEATEERQPSLRFLPLVPVFIPCSKQVHCDASAK